MTALEPKTIQQIDELTKRIHNLEMVVFISTMSQAECAQPAADRINKALMKMFYAVSKSFGQFESMATDSEHKLSEIGLVYKNGNKF